MPATKQLILALDQKEREILLNIFLEKEESKNEKEELKSIIKEQKSKIEEQEHLI